MSDRLCPLRSATPAVVAEAPAGLGGGWLLTGHPRGEEAGLRLLVVAGEVALVIPMDAEMDAEGGTAPSQCILELSRRQFHGLPFALGALRQVGGEATGEGGLVDRHGSVLPQHRHPPRRRIVRAGGAALRVI